jgi:acyl-CoA synthetase (AMP-forming)/AMP-acid ligase II
VTEFNLGEVVATVAAAVPDREAVVWRDRRITYRQLDERANRLASHLLAAGLTVRAERADLAPHQSGQDHLGLYLRNGNEYLEGMIGSYKARVAPFNVNFRYVEDELAYLLDDAGARALVYHAEFAPTLARVLDGLPRLQVLLQVDDGSGHDLLPGAVDYEVALAAASPEPPAVTPSPDDLYIVYTGGTTGMPKGVLWRQADIYVAAMGGRPFGGTEELADHAALAKGAVDSAGGFRTLLLAPLMHGAAQWASWIGFTAGGCLAIPDDVHRLDPVDVWRTVERERLISLPVVGDAVARPLVEELERGTYDLSGFFVVANGGAPLNAGLKDRLLAAVPHLTVIDAVGASETGYQMSHGSSAGAKATTGTFDPDPDTVVVDDAMARVLDPGDDTEGWLARRGRVPLGYLGDADKTARTFPTIDGVRCSVPGDRARLRADGSLELLGRASSTINTGGEKVFAEEVEQAVAHHPSVADVIVVGRPSDRWGQEVVALVQLQPGAAPDEAGLLEVCGAHLARYKLPKAFVFLPALVRSPAGKADHRWARQQAIAHAETPVT